MCKWSQNGVFLAAISVLGGVFWAPRRCDNLAKARHASLGFVRCAKSRGPNLMVAGSIPTCGAITQNDCITYKIQNGEDVYEFNDSPGDGG